MIEADDDGNGNVVLVEAIAGSVQHEYSDGDVNITVFAGTTASDDGNGNVMLT